MHPVNFKQAVCHLCKVKEQDYVRFVLNRSLFWRARLVRPVVHFFYPDFLFQERRLVEKIAAAANLREIQEEVDFYQHKYVVNFVMKDALRFRLSGMRLMSLANKAFIQAGQQQSNASQAQESVNP
jgi:hypothetical protein